eukprot:scaffold101119_cov31-Tisochrysis_lutea.AAC.2
MSSHPCVWHPQLSSLSFRASAFLFRYSKAFYLVKWLGRPRWQVSWEDAATLDTPWCRRLIVASLRADVEHPNERPILPPCHPLIDRLAGMPAPVAEGSDAENRAMNECVPEEAQAGPPVTVAHCTDLPPGFEVVRRVSKTGKPYIRYAGPDGRLVETKSKAWLVHNGQAGGAVTPPRLSAKASAAPSAADRGAPPVSGGASAEAKPQLPATPPGTVPAISSIERASAKPSSYIGYLCYLREQRARLRASAPHGTSKQIEKAAAEEWKALSLKEREPVIERARKLLSEKLEAARSAAELKACIVMPDAAHGTSGGSAARASWLSRGGRNSDGRRRRACECCGELDGRDSVRCATCPARRHLMCFMPPLVEADDNLWQCDTCVDALLEGAPLTPLPDVGSEVEVEVAEAEAAGGATSWQTARVTKALAEGRFSVVIGGDEAFVEELSMDDEGVGWRRTEATMLELERQRDRAKKACGDLKARRRIEAERAQVDVTPRPNPQLAKVETLYREGYVVADGCITADQVKLTSCIWLGPFATRFARYTTAPPVLTGASTTFQRAHLPP